MTAFIVVSVALSAIHLAAYFVNVATGAAVVATPGGRAFDSFIAVITLGWGLWLLAKGN